MLWVSRNIQLMQILLFHQSTVELKALYSNFLLCLVIISFPNCLLSTEVIQYQLHSGLVFLSRFQLLPSCFGLFVLIDVTVAAAI